MSTTGSLRTKSACAKTEYRAVVLPVNRVELLTLSKLGSREELKDRYEALKTIPKDIASSVDFSLPESELTSLGGCLNFVPGGYNNKQVFERALKIPDEADNLRDAYEMGWVIFLNDIWKFFDLQEVFTFSADNTWSGYDIAVMQLLPKRANLSVPKPDFAFGLRWPADSPFFDYAHNWIDYTIPSTNAFCTPTLSFPFLICESKSSAGILRTAENQLCNSLIKGHDILCSLNLQHELHLLGMTQVGPGIDLYASVSTQKCAAQGKLVVDKIHIVHLLHCDLLSFSGSLSFLRFVEYAKAYGAGVFHDAIETALRRAFE